MIRQSNLSRHLSRAHGAGALILVLLASCSQGQKRDYLGPPDPTPVDNTIAAVVVVPRVGTLMPGEALDLAAFGRTAKGDSVGVGVNWTASGGSVDAPGRFEATIPGSYWIVARSVTQANIADSANVLVVGPDNPITRVVVSPKTLSIRIGQTRQFAAVAYFQDGTPAPAPIFWSASGGTISSAGEYSAPGVAGDYLVLAVVGNGLVDTATVTVGDVPVLTSMALEPATDSLLQGGSRQYLVSASWSDGSSATPQVDFSTTGGIIDSTGTFTAAAPIGDYLVLAKERGGNRTANARVWVLAPDLVSIRIAPSTIALSPGSSQRFSASGLLADGSAQKVTVNWQASGGTITGSGQYVAGSTAGAFSVIATESGGVLADTAVVVISVPTATLTQLVVNPSAVTVPGGGTYQFTASGSWSDGSSATPTVDWTATGGTISAQGEYVAGTVPGTYRVIGKQRGGTLADTSVVTVAAPQLESLVLTPSVVSVEAGQTQAFSVTASWTDGSAALPTLAWTPSGGTITAGGAFTAGSAPGTYRLIVRDQAATVADTSFITVTSPAPMLQAVVISPASVALAVNDQQQFFVSGVWTNGGTGVPQVTWSTTGGAVSAAGLYTAGSTPGQFLVIAREPTSGTADTAVVTVQPKAPQLVGLQLLPDGATVQAGGSQNYSVQGIWTSGGSGAPPVYFSATGGIISSSGHYTAGATPGTYRVVAVQQGGSLADTVSVTVTSAPPVLTGIAVTPATASLQTNGSQQFAVAGIWTNGGTGAPAVTWTATGGNITQTGLYTAGANPGSYRVVATQQGGSLADTSVVTVSSSAPTLASLAIQPGNVTVQTGTSQTFGVTGTWSDGSTDGPTVTWSTTGGGTISSSGVYLAGSVAGVWKVIATWINGPVADTVTVTIGAPYVTKINLTPASATVATGAKQQFAVSANWSDGVNRPVAVSYAATGGTISVSGLYTAGQITNVFRVIAACTCGKADTSAVTVTQSTTPPVTLVALQLTPGSATLTPGATQQFTTSARWSDGSTTTASSVTYSASGGSIASSGRYTAPSATGNYLVVASGGGMADTAGVTVQSGGRAPYRGSSRIFMSTTPRRTSFVIPARFGQGRRRT